MIERIVRERVAPALCIVGEPTSMRVVNAHKSIRSFRTTVTGFEAHSSRTHEGVSAIIEAAGLITFLDGIAAEMRDRGDPSGRFDPPYTSLSVGIIEGGTAVNIIPRECAFAWEYRSLPGTDAEEIRERFLAQCETEAARLKRRAPQAGIATIDRSNAPGLFMAPGAPEEGIALHLAERNACEAVSYATEAGLFQAAHIPTYVCGPGDIAQAHKPNEFVPIADLRACERFLDRLIAHLS